MNRRSFFTKLGLAAASIAILPPATTYARRWVASVDRKILTDTNLVEVAPLYLYDRLVLNMGYGDAIYEIKYIFHPKAFERFSLNEGRSRILLPGFAG